MCHRFPVTALKNDTIGKRLHRGCYKVKYVYVFAILLLSLSLFPGTAHAQDPEPTDMQEMQNRLDELEKQLKKLSEESKARKTLQITEEEKKQQEKEVLEAVSREYTLEPKNTLSIDYSLGYSYTRTENITDDPLTMIRSTHHSITHGISSSYSILDNLSSSLTLPIVYKYNKLGTDDEMDQTDLGDISLGAAWQPFTSKPGAVHSTLSFGLQLPTGRSPYKINPEKELSTGDGVYSLNMGGNFSKSVDPVVVFWSLGYRHAFERKNLDHRVYDTLTLDDVKPGDSFSISAGMGYALSYVTSMNMIFSYQYAKSTSIKYKEFPSAYKTGDSVSASFAVGMGWKVTQKTTLSYSLSYSLTDPTFAFTFRIPFSFVL